MRVIAGEARGRRLEALPGTDVTRPTLDQVKEAMFSIVQFDLPGARVLDLYAGSGQLGIEALSRGAARCVFLDENRDAVNIVMKNCKNCGVFDRSRVNIGEAARYLSACHEQFDLVLLDPPFRGGTLEKILPGVEKRVAPGGIVLCESETGLVLPAEVGSLTLKKQYKYGKVLLWKRALECPFRAANALWTWNKFGTIWTRSARTSRWSCGRPSPSSVTAPS